MWESTDTLVGTSLEEATIVRILSGDKLEGIQTEECPREASPTRELADGKPKAGRWKRIVRVRMNARSLPAV